MAEDKNDIIKSGALSFPWWTGMSTGIAAVVAAILPVLSEFRDLGLDEQAIQSLFLIAAVGAIATAIVVSVDALARAWVTAAKLTSSAGAAVDATPAKDGATSLLSPFATPVAPFEVQVRNQGQGSFTVLAIAWDESKKEMYLVGREDACPIWVKAEQIERVRKLPSIDMH